MMLSDYNPLFQIAANILAIFAGLYAIVHRAKRFFSDAAQDRAEQINQISNDMTALLEKHEEKDQSRHTENVQRLTRLETLVINGHSRRGK